MVAGTVFVCAVTPGAKTITDCIPAAGATRLEDELRDGELYAQVAFSAAPEQGFRREDTAC